MVQSSGYAAHAAHGKLEPFQFQRREPRPNDIVIEISHCGICHSDLHIVDNDMGRTPFPVVPGHEIVGRVIKTGPGVTKFKVGEVAAVGCFTDTCGKCEACVSGNEHMCFEGVTPSCVGLERDGKQRCWGGISDNYVIDENFALKIPARLDMAAAAPLLCAGITTYSPLRYWNVGPGKTVGIVGLGGLGHIAVKLASAMGADVTVFTGSLSKVADARKLGATDAVVSTDPEAMKSQIGRFDFILDTISAPHEIDPLLACLKPESALCLLGVAPGSLSFSPNFLVYEKKIITGSVIGSLEQTQEMIDFCAERGIVAEIELISPREVNEAFERLRRNNVKYRFVVDLAR